MRITTCRASRGERRRPMPADPIVPGPMGTITNAVTIDAPPERVWPWLAQMGAGRAGWYSYDRVDNGGAPSAQRLMSEYQDVVPGDILPALPGAKNAFVVAAVDPPRDLILIGPDAGTARGPRASWEFLLQPLDRGRTRLIVRGRVSSHWLDPQPDQGRSAPPRGPIFIERVYGLMARMPRSLLLPFARAGHRLMQARQLRGIKRRAESSSFQARLSGRGTRSPGSGHCAAAAVPTTPATNSP
jgi:hypothetical protein